MLKDKVVAFNSRSVPRNATDKMSLARFPTSSAALRLKESRESAPRTLGRQKVPRDLRLWKYPLIFGPSKFAAQARFSIGAQGQNQGLAWSSVSSLWGNQVKKKGEKLQVLDRTKALHGPRTQAYGETKYKKEK